jgi:hypothetical protein
MAMCATTDSHSFRTAICVAAFALVLATNVAEAATSTIGASKDNTIFEHNSLNSSGGAAGLRAGTNGMGSPRRGLIAFDIAGNLPAGATITDVQLRVYLGDSSPGTRDVGLHRLTRDWGEGTAGSDNPVLGGTGQGSPANPGDATWSHAMLGSVAWSGAGAEGDFNSTASGVASIGDILELPYTWNSTAALVSDVQGWLDAPATNFGWALINDEEETIRSLKVFYSHNASQNLSGDSLDPSWRPSLTITYESAAQPSGDYNGNGVVDAADYVMWRKTLDASATPAGSGADGDQSGMIDEGDYSHWQRRFGQTTSGVGGGGSAVVPEPVPVLMLAVGLPLVFVANRR